MKKYKMCIKTSIFDDVIIIVDAIIKKNWGIKISKLYSAKYSTFLKRKAKHWYDYILWIFTMNNYYCGYKNVDKITLKKLETRLKKTIFYKNDFEHIEEVK